MPVAGFELSSEQPQTHAFDRVATGIGFEEIRFFLNLIRVLIACNCDLDNIHPKVFFFYFNHITPEGTLGSRKALQE
jgi:hypothetical protein